MPRPAATLAYTPSDPLAGSQWHLAAIGNLARIWDEFTGAGIHVGIYDDGVQYTHHDLNAPYDATRQVRIGSTTYDGINLAADGHGTSVAGLIAAENDGIGTVGIAFGAGITGVNIFDPNSPLDINATNASSFFTALRQGTNFDVINHSWGSEPLFDPADNPNISGSFSEQALSAYAHVAATGRASLGSITVQAAGNEQRDANGDGVNASRYTITVAAVGNTGLAASYSNHGASILVAAPGSEDAPGLGITSTDLLGTAGYNNIATPNTASDYTDDFGGTSAATPIVAAVVALMLDANPGLGWRDVQNILAASARQTGSALGATVAGTNEEGVWQLNRADGWNGGGMHIHPDYGHGHLNAYNAVRMAEAWSLFAEAQSSPNEQSLSQTVNIGGTRTIPDNGATNASFTVASGLIVEHVEITLTISHRRFTDLRIFLTSAEGTRVTLVDGTAGDDTSADTALTWTFGIDTLRGETTGGSWKLDLQDVASGTTGTLANNFTFKVYGTTAGANSVYHYTDELGLMAALPGQSGRLNLADGDGGIDWIDAAAVSGDSFISLLGGTVSRIAGRQVIMSAGIENAVTGDGDDELYGDAAANRLYGMRGLDRIDGGAGHDILDGGAGSDTLIGGMGDDQFLVDSAGDVLIENVGEGADTAWIGATTAVAVGANIEIIRLYGAGRAATGSAGAEQMVANPGLASSLDGGGGDDVLWGGILTSTLTGGMGDDIIRGGSGGGTFSGGAGNDQFVIAGLATVVIETAGQGTDTAWVTVNGYTAGANIEIIRLAGTASLVTGGEDGAQLVGNPVLASELRGGSGDDVLWGGSMADALKGGAGNDILRGQGGADTMTGGTGDDQFVVLDPGVTIIENAGEGYDTAWVGLAANTAFTLASGVERGNLSGAANRLTGNGLANVLVGDAVASRLDGAGGDDILFGSVFADTLTGGAGNDTLYSYGGADLFIYAGAGWGLDQIGGFSQAAGARLDFRGSGIGFGQLGLNVAGGNTQVNAGADVILVFGAVLSVGDFLFG